ncbi:MAG: FRG domain-containing protein [Candidatus Rokubacteria bacterium]|nr:FRG domain-containing protein [Candidatus Rokubacteria bacterium]
MARRELFQPRRISSYEELANCIQVLTRRSPSARLVFRGQTSFHGGRLIPSVRRPRASDPPLVADMWQFATAGMIGRMFARRQGLPDSPFLEHALKHYLLTDELEWAGSILNDLFGMVLQHYGSRSHYVDVSTSLDHALWFAHYQFCSSLLEVPTIFGAAPGAAAEPIDRRDHLKKLILAASYRPAWPHGLEDGYLFAITPARTIDERTTLEAAEEASALRHGDFLDLSPWEEFTRAQRQCAGVVFCDVSNGDGAVEAPLMQGVFVFALPLRGAEHVFRWTVSHLFPSPREDWMYAEILSQSAFVQAQPNASSLTRLNPLPEYYSGLPPTDDPGWVEHRACDRVIWPTWLHPWLQTPDNRLGTWAIADREYRAQDDLAIIAEPLLLRDLLDHESIRVVARSQSIAFAGDDPFAAEKLAIDRLSRAWPFQKPSVFIEFHPYKWAVVSPEFEPSLIRGRREEELPAWMANVRAVQIIRHGRAFGVRLFRLGKSGIEASAGHWFTPKAIGYGIPAFSVEPSSLRQSDEARAEEAWLCRMLVWLLKLAKGEWRLRDARIGGHTYCVIHSQ